MIDKELMPPLKKLTFLMVAYVLASYSFGEYTAGSTGKPSSPLEPFVSNEISWPIRDKENFLNFFLILAGTQCNLFLDLYLPEGVGICRKLK